MQADARRWAAGGGMHLTGPPEGAGLGPPVGLIPLLDTLADRIAVGSSIAGRAVRLDPIAVITERAAWHRSIRRGGVSCGGACRLFPTDDGWVAVSLARDEDVDLVPAFVGSTDDADPWFMVERFCASHTTADVVARAVLLGLAAGGLTRTETGDAPDGDRPDTDNWATDVRGAPAPPRTAENTTVIDLSALWAGPLCGRILADTGCTVIKVESVGRPDGARRGRREFFDRLNHDKASVALDFSTANGRRGLADLVAGADVVIEASRPRALKQLGIDALDSVRRGPQVWVSITGHGWSANGHRVGFGDDAAVAGGLVVRDSDRPYFCADAVADPLTGLMAAAEVLEALVVGGRRHLDIALRAVASLAAGPTVPMPSDAVASPPTRPAVVAEAAALGADTETVMTRMAQ